MEVFNASHANQELVQSLQELEQSFFPNPHNANWQILCEELVEPLKGWWPAGQYASFYVVPSKTFQFLAKCSIAERLKSVGVMNWRINIKNMVEGISSLRSDDATAYFDNIHSKLVTYEHEYHQLKAATSLLELALWKCKIDESMPTIQCNNAGQKRKTNDHIIDMKIQCRINCGAGIIIPNVLPFLIADRD